MGALETRARRLAVAVTGIAGPWRQATRKARRAWFHWPPRVQATHCVISSECRFGDIGRRKCGLRV